MANSGCHARKSPRERNASRAPDDALARQYCESPRIPMITLRTRRPVPLERTAETKGCYIKMRCVAQHRYRLGPRQTACIRLVTDDCAGSGLAGQLREEIPNRDWCVEIAGFAAQASPILMRARRDDVTAAMHGVQQDATLSR